jgi:uncharacterized protein with NRDE domain
VSDFLTAGQPAETYLETVKAKGDRYNGFNLLAGDSKGLYYFSNRSHDNVLRLAPGYYGLSNHLLNTDWPKVRTGVRKLTELLEKDHNLYLEALFDLLTDQAVADDDQLPSTGIPLEWERALSSIFIRTPNYGTRSSSLLFVDHKGRMAFYERTWKSDTDRPVEAETRVFKVSQIVD